MGQADYFLAGSWNFRCDECWRKGKAGEAFFRWDGAIVCWRCWEIRNPQDYVRGIPDRQDLPWSRPTPPVFITNTGLNQLTGPSQLLDSYMLDSTLLG